MIKPSDSKYALPCILFILFLSLVACKESIQVQDYTTWEEFQGGPERNQYSTLDQFTKKNVPQLKVAWSYSLPNSGQMQMNPIVVDTMLYGIGPNMIPFALNAKTGKKIWSYGDPLKAWYANSRGVTYWSDGNNGRIFYGVGSNIFALDAATGELIESFGESGVLDLRTGLPEIAKDKFIISPGPGVTYNDLVIFSVRVSEGADAAPGDIRAFDASTGELRWTFHTTPYPGEEGHETWENKEAYKNTNTGGINNWCGMAVDRKLGILYVPLGSASPDFYGVNRLGDNLYANCLLALDINNGKKLWHFQFTHHDLWDRDLPSTPNLIEVLRNGKKVKAISQTTKQGYVYVFDRQTGKPLFDIDEVPVPESTIPNEIVSPTQPIPKKPAPFARQSYELTTDDISPYAENKEELKEALKTADKRMYAPPGLDPVLLLPGYDGGAEWGGAAADPENGILYVNSNEMAWFLGLEANTAAETSKTQGEALYLTNCASCHRKDRKGTPESRSPSLLNIKSKFSEKQLVSIMENGQGMMPAFPQLETAEKNKIALFLLEMEEDASEIESLELADQDEYLHTGYKKFLDSNGLPAISPPWGTLNAIDLNTGEYLWKVPLGETMELKAQGFPTTGTENYGGPVITKNGLLFIAATKDGYFRAFDRDTGKILWEYRLPAASFATPSLYQVDGKQYIVLACGGGKLGTKKGNQIIAFSL